VFHEIFAVEAVASAVSLREQPLGEIPIGLPLP
jgi:hypothetical protein